LLNDIGSLIDINDKDDLIYTLKNLYLKHVGKEDLEGMQPEIKSVKDIFMQEKKVNSENVKSELELQNERL